MHNWKVARSDVLRQEVEDAIFRLGGAGNEVNLRASLGMADSYVFLVEQYGSIENMSKQGIKLVSKMLREKAKAKFNLDMGLGHGLFLLSAYYESKILPGIDASFVNRLTSEFLSTALLIRENFNSSEPKDSLTS